MIDRRDTLILAVNAEAPDSATIARAAEFLRAGGLVAFPTETVYGLGANALDARAVAGIFAAKQRPATDPMIVHVAAPAEAARVAADLPGPAARLMDRFWPGPLTLVLPRGAAVPPIVTAGGETVAVRCPAHPVALALIRAAGMPLAAPSANRFSHTSPTTAAHVWHDLAGRIDLILDAGPTAIGVESTVLDLTASVPTVLRPGGVPLEALRSLLDAVELASEPGDGEPLRSPGQLERHYAPRAELRLFAGPDVAVRAALHQAALTALAAGRTPALLLATEDLPALDLPGVPAIAVGRLTEPAAVARQLYRALRDQDRPGVDLILARAFPEVGLGLAVSDRLRRAASRVIACG